MIIRVTSIPVDKKSLYLRRMSFYIVTSIAMHFLFLSLLMKLPVRSQVALFPEKTQPIVVKFINQEQQKSIKKLVEVSQPSEEKPQNTENIAEVNTVASGLEVKQGDKPGPLLNEKSDYETLGSESKKMQVANVIPKKDLSQTIASENITDKKGVSAKKILRGNNDSPKVVMEEKSSPFKPKNTDSENKTAAKQVQEDTENPSDLLKSFSKKPQGKIYNQVKKEGILGFEALQDQLAPYLRQIQKKVEQYWIHFLLTRYSGTKSTEVIIDCEINSEGKIVKIEVVGQPDDPFYTAICKEALQKASPFSPFLFQVPDIYQNKNLQIRWTFRFM
ncbi:MAG: TonB C-terminal domain-containing protein [Candidatus Hydrogenedens sp.]|nr:TonB C-terminal domain-containing protein [Candidatus Hydrogenedens sp.]